MKIIIVHSFKGPFLGGNLNMRELLNPIFFERSVRHPDSKRQRCSRLRTLARSGARKLKHMEVPRSLIAPVELYSYDIDREYWRTF
jgi:hypothetical protein